MLTELTEIEKKHACMALRRALTEPVRGAANTIRWLQSLESRIAAIEAQLNPPPVNADTVGGTPVEVTVTTEYLDQSLLTPGEPEEAQQAPVVEEKPKRRKLSELIPPQE